MPSFQNRVSTSDSRITESLLYERRDDNASCNTCERRCEIGIGELGFCKTRQNIDGKIRTLVYGDISLMEAHPIEHKPLFHFYPGSTVLTVSTWSCNFVCGWCFRKFLSRAPENIGRGHFLSPSKFLEILKESGCQGTSISFNEPTLLLEWAIDVFPLTRSEGYFNTYVTNGYMTSDALKLLAEYGLGAMNIDIKGDADAVRQHCGGDVARIWQRAIEAKALGLWVEITTLIIPQITDDERCLREIARRIKNDLGPDTPWHVNAYFPRDEVALSLHDKETPLDSLVRARDIGIGEGLHYVYAGGYHSPHQNTYCPYCGELLIERYGFGFDFFQYNMGTDNKCPKCGNEIPIVGIPVPYHGRL